MTDVCDALGHDSVILRNWTEDDGADTQGFCKHLCCICGYTWVEEIDMVECRKRVEHMLTKAYGCEKSS